MSAGHPSSVDALVKYDTDTVITGSSDGIIRIVNILPNRSEVLHSLTETTAYSRKLYTHFALKHKSLLHCNHFICGLYRQVTHASQRLHLLHQ